MARFPTGRTAFVVIHGIGEQNPFETLDGFGRGLLGLFESKGIDFRLAHQLRRHPLGWTESCLRIAPKQGKSLIDLHEVYWAYLTENQISTSEVRRWLEKTLAGTKQFFTENQELIEKYEEADQVEQLRKLNRKLLLAATLYPVASFLLGMVSPLQKFGGQWFEAIEKGLGRLVSPFLTGYLGDLAIYTTTDRKSKFFNLRQKILADSLEMLKLVLNDPEIERVILCGHSLGSVIAYDSLNRLQIEASLPDAEPLPLEKLAGLVTFGSPLDKIAYFFREHAGEKEDLRRTILGQLHSFKSKQLDFKEPKYEMADPVKPVLQDLPWMNFWDRQDPVSGKLHLYRIAPQDNVELKMGEAWGKAHLGYWGFGGVYEDVGKRFLGVT